MNNLVSDVYNKKISSIKIGNGIYKIKFAKFIKHADKSIKLSKEEAVIGKASIFPNRNKHIITLRKDIKKEKRPFILYHEISHAIFHEMTQLPNDERTKIIFKEFNNNENIVNNLTNILITLEGNSK